MLLWLLPVVIGLLLSPWLVMLTSRRDLGVWTRRAGLFATPEELRPSQLLLEGGTEWDNVVQIEHAQHGRKEGAAPDSRNGDGEQIGRAHVRTPVTNAKPDCRLLLEKTKN